MKRVVCFGDSNTWGYIANEGGRYPKNIRWTGVLQELLGDEYEIIEEGQNGRTIASADPWEWGTKCGLDYCLPMLESHMPLDLLIIMLGSNDMKQKFNLPAPDIAGSLQNMLLKIKSHLEYHLNSSDTRILIISPPLIGDKIHTSPFFEFVNGDTILKTSKDLAKWYKLVADEFGCDFLDGSIVSGCDGDSLHLDEKGHRVLAEAIYQKVKNTI